MDQSSPHEGTFLRDLGDGLILRRATVADTEALVAFNARIHGSPDGQAPDHAVGVWTRDLMTQGEGRVPHPTFDVGDFTIVEDSATGEVVSSLNLISQTWSYAGIRFGVGRPELVGTAAAYRNRGLVRAQFEVIHEWSAERGEMVQGITGIPYYYRLFGYEMALGLGGVRSGFEQHVPKLKPGQSEPYPLRPATEADLPFMAHLYEQAAARHMVTCVRDEALWRYELLGCSPESITSRQLRIIESPEGEPVGFFAHPAQLWGKGIAAVQYELKSDISWLAVTPSVIRYLWRTGEQYTARDAARKGAQNNQKLSTFRFSFGTEHPIYQAAHNRLPHTTPPYAWFIRVPDLPRFLRHITPVLEERLANSIAVGHTGELNISFYRSGLRFTFQNGQLSIEPWQPPHTQKVDAAFPDLTFLQLLFGYRSLDQLKLAFPDCWTKGDAPPLLLNTLFPKKLSNPWPIS
ncbi:MAG: GNAT family N-acetyltransferase [Ardenticatenaceae bacterium]